MTKNQKVTTNELFQVEELETRLEMQGECDTTCTDNDTVDIDIEVENSVDVGCW
ncbi:hypothetical protein [Marivirga sp.]|uniref:hypothetical protein n=1 Tax=Marivirga sp. TaxID=2018662 RepID=UPI003DA6E335